jgi:hypothetical protein
LKALLRHSLFVVGTGEDRYLLGTALLLLHIDWVDTVTTDGRGLSPVKTAKKSWRRL